MTSVEDGLRANSEDSNGRVTEHRAILPKMASTKKLVICAAGVFFCYFYYGLIQEKITKTKYGEHEERFTFTLSLVFCQCIVNAAFACLIVYLTDAVSDKTPSSYYALCSFTYLTAMLSSNQALQYVPYPTQVLGKSCKPIPIMILGVLLAHKRYPLRKYFFVLLIVLGVSLFLYKDKKPSEPGKIAKPSFEFGLGEMLLLLSLSMDGGTGAVQERMRAGYATKSHHMMLRMNVWSTLYLAFGLLVSGEVFGFLNFVSKYPMIIFDMISFSVASSLGQYFIFVTVADFGPLPCSIITTTRKFFTILASVIYFQHPLTTKQWTGTLMVFLGLSLDSFFGKSPPKGK